MKRSTALWIAFAGAALVLVGCATVANVVSQQALSTGPNGPETPASLGVPFERVSIPSHGRRLDGYLVRAPADCRDPPAILIYHGFDETISFWVQAQEILWRHCVSSLVFDPSGSGDSTRPASLMNLAEDAPSAYAFARGRFAAPVRLYVMGHSMGDAVMLAAEPGLSPPPAGVIVADAFASLKEFYALHGVSRILLAAMPDWWDNAKAVRQVHVPVLVVHSDADILTPLEQGRRLYAAANPPKQIAVLHGFKHNGLRRDTSDDWWGPVLGFVGSPGVSHAPRLPAAGGPVPAPDLAAETAREEELRAGAVALAPSSAPAAASGPTALSPQAPPPAPDSLALPPPASPSAAP